MAGHEPSFEEVRFQLLKNPAQIPSFFLLDPAYGFINRARVEFIPFGQEFIRGFLSILLHEFNHTTLPEVLRPHVYALGEGPLGIIVGGSALNYFLGISVPSTDLDIDILPLINKTYDKEKVVFAKPIPMYTESGKLTALYEVYLTWIQDTLDDIIQNKYNFVASPMSPMVMENIQTNVEVIQSHRFGEVRSIRKLLDGNYISAQIVNQNFFSKVALWMRSFENLERIVEFKILSKFPENLFTDYVAIPQTRGVLAIPSNKTFIENAIQTLSYRIDALHRDAITYDKTILGFYKVPAIDYWKREEYYREKILTSKMRISDIFARVTELFYRADFTPDMLIVLLKYIVTIFDKQSLFYANPHMKFLLADLKPEQFPKYNTPGFHFWMTTMKYGKLMEVEALYNTLLASGERQVPPFPNSKSQVEFEAKIGEVMSLDRAETNSKREIRSKRLALEKPKLEENILKPSEAEELRPESPNLSDGLNGEEEMTEAEKEKQINVDVVELASTINAVKNVKKEAMEERVMTLLERQRAVREEKKAAAAALRAKQAEERVIRERKAKQKRDEEKRIQQIKEKEEADALEEAIAEVKKQEKVLEGAAAQLEAIKRRRKIVFFHEPEMMFHNQLWKILNQTFYPMFYPGDDGGFTQPIIIMKFSDNTGVLHRDRVEMIPSIPEENQIIRTEMIATSHFRKCHEMVLYTLKMLYSDYPIPNIFIALGEALNILSSFSARYQPDILTTKSDLEEFQSKSKGGRDSDILKGLDSFYAKTTRHLFEILYELYNHLRRPSNDAELPAELTDEEFYTIYSQIQKWSLNLYTPRDKKKRETDLANCMNFYRKVLVTHSIYRINDANLIKNNQIGEDIPLIVVLPRPNNYRDEFVYSSIIQPNRFNFAFDLYKELQKYHFSFWESYPLTEEYKTKISTFQESLDAILASKQMENAELERLVIKQLAELTLRYTFPYWKESTTPERYNIFLIEILKRKYLLNSNEEWTLLKSLIETPTVSEEALHAIGIELIKKADTLWNHYYMSSTEQKQIQIEIKNKQKRDFEESVTEKKAKLSTLQKIRNPKSGITSQIAQLLSELEPLNKEIEKLDKHINFLKKSITIQSKFTYPIYLDIFRKEIQKIVAQILDSDKLQELIVISSDAPGKIGKNGGGRRLRRQRKTRKQIRMSKGRKTRKIRARQSHS